MGIIRRMDPHLANMIAAGEVVERPANVVKELIENAIDAHAKTISVELKGGGLESIRVTDDGSGMDEADLSLAFERHATSKIQTERDLFRIASLGFRGEALPSIAAVASIVAQSCQEGADGHQIHIQHGEIRSRGLAPSRKGTVIQVTKLFHNTPARLKYIKSAQTELAAIADVLDKAALSHPTIAFVLEHEGKPLLRTTGKGDALEAIQRVYGNDVAKHAISFEGENRDYRIRGYLASPMHTKAHRLAITAIVNGRVVRNYKISQTITEVYGQTIPKGRYPIAVIWIEADPSILDVNIHPTKQEIKFSEEERLHQLIRGAAKDALAATPYLGIADASKANVPFTQERFIEERPLTHERPESSESSAAPIESSPTVPGPWKTGIPGRLPQLSYLSQYYGTYLLFQNEEGLYLLDQHAAAERIRYERYLARMSRSVEQGRDLLIPMSLEFSTEETLRLNARLNELETIGFHLSKIGERAFHVQSIPVWIPDDLIQEAAEELCRQAIDGESLDAGKAVDRLAILLACKHSLKANRFVSAAEAAALLDDLSRCEQPYTCPHGRPILVKIPHSDVERWFKRIA